MIPISEILLPGHVNLSLTGKDQAAGIDELLVKFNGDPRVINCDALVQAVTERNAPAISCNGVGVCIAHGRTNAVQSLVMAAGRSEKGLVSPEIREKVRLVFVAGIPSAFDSEYLRIVGSIARFCRDKELLDKVLKAPTPDDFITLLSRQEVKL